MEIIDKSTNELKYKSDMPIIYVADYYFKETKGIKKKEHILKDELYCSAQDRNLNYYKRKLNVKEDKKIKLVFEITKIVLTMKVSYTQIGFNQISKVETKEEFETRNKKDWFNKM